MENIPIRNGLYTITHEGQTQFYHTRSFGSLHDVLDLLNTNKQAYDKVDKRRPDSNIPEAKRLPMYSQSLAPIVFYQPSLLFQPLDQEEFGIRMEELDSGNESTAHYMLDYDADQFAMTSWDNDGLWTVKAPLSGIIDAYRGAIHRHGRARNFDEKEFLDAAETILSVERTAGNHSAPELGTGSEPQKQMDKPQEKFTGFTEQSM